MRASVIIPSYNAASTLQETLDSIIPQLTQEDEAIIIDDGSTDNTLDIVTPYLSSNVTYLRQENSGGPAGPRNKGISHAKGRYIFLFDSDDLMLPGKISQSVAALERYPNAGMLFTNFRTIDEDGEILKSGFLDDYTLISKLQKNQSEDTFLINVPEACLHLASENFIGTSGVVIRRDVVTSIGGFDESLKNGDDRDMWFRVTRSYPILFLNQQLHCYRICENSISNGSPTKRAIHKIKVLEKQLKNPINNTFRKSILLQLSNNYHDISYEALNNGEKQKAKTNAVKSLQFKVSIRNIELLIKTTINPKLLTLIRRTKHKVIQSRAHR